MAADFFQQFGMQPADSAGFDAAQAGLRQRTDPVQTAS